MVTEKREGYQVVPVRDVATSILEGRQDRVPPAHPSVGKWQVVTDIEGGRVVLDSKADRTLALHSEGAFRWYIDTLLRAGLNLGWTMAPVWWLTSNRLPEDGERVLVYLPRRQRYRVTEAIYKLGDFITTGFAYGWQDVEAWTPLPVPPDEWGAE